MYPWQNIGPPLSGKAEFFNQTRMFRKDAREAVREAGNTFLASPTDQINSRQDIDEADGIRSQKPIAISQRTLIGWQHQSSWQLP